MKTFPKILNVKNKGDFTSFYYDVLKSDMRKSLTRHILSNPEDDFYMLEKFMSEKCIKLELAQKLIRDLIPELQSLGWTCALGFGDTALFIYGDKKPSNCYFDPVPLSESLNEQHL